MTKLKRIYIISFLFILVGSIGCLFTFKSITRPITTTQKKKLYEDFHHIHISTQDTDIKIVPTNQTKPHIKVINKSSKSGKYHFTMSIHDSTLYIKNSYRQAGLIHFFPSYSIIKIYIPNKLYDSLQIDTNDGDTVITQLQSKQINIESKDGDNSLKNIQSNTLSLRTNDGDNVINQLQSKQINIESKDGDNSLENIQSNTLSLRTNDVDNVLHHIQSSTIKMQSKDGDNTLRDITGQIMGASRDGDIFLIDDHLDKHIHLQTHDGDITIQTKNKPTNSLISTDVQDGNSIIFHNAHNQVQFGKGTNKIELTTKDGDITVK